jgi:hypothetical protein
MQITTSPASRFGWPGQTLEYVVRAEGASEIAAVQECPEGVQVRVLGTRAVGNGVEARVAVDVADGVLY